MSGGIQTPLTEAEKGEILDAYKSGESKNGIALRFGRSWATIDKVIKQSGEAEDIDTLRNEERRDVVASGYGLAGKVLDLLSSPGMLERIPASKLITVYNGLMANGREEQRIQMNFETIMREAIKLVEEELVSAIRSEFKEYPQLQAQMEQIIKKSAATKRTQFLSETKFLRTEVIKSRIRAAAMRSSSFLQIQNPENTASLVFLGQTVPVSFLLDELDSLPLDVQLLILQRWQTKEIDISSDLHGHES